MTTVALQSVYFMPLPEEEQHRENECGEASSAEDLHQAQIEFAESIRRQVDRELILHPERWPRYPLLCLIHRQEREQATGLPAPGVMHAEGALWVCRANLYDLLGGKLSREEIDTRSVEYTSLEELLNDWQVD